MRIGILLDMCFLPTYIMDVCRGVSTILLSQFMSSPLTAIVSAPADLVFLQRRWLILSSRLRGILLRCCLCWRFWSFCDCSSPNLLAVYAISSTSRQGLCLGLNYWCWEICSGIVDVYMCDKSLVNEGRVRGVQHLALAKSVLGSKLNPDNAAVYFWTKKSTRTAMTTGQQNQPICSRWLPRRLKMGYSWQ